MKLIVLISLQIRYIFVYANTFSHHGVKKFNIDYTYCILYQNYLQLSAVANIWTSVSTYLLFSTAFAAYST